MVNHAGLFYVPFTVSSKGAVPFPDDAWLRKYGLHLVVFGGEARSYLPIDRLGLIPKDVIMSARALGDHRGSLEGWSASL